MSRAKCLLSVSSSSFLLLNFRTGKDFQSPWSSNLLALWMGKLRNRVARVLPKEEWKNVLRAPFGRVGSPGLFTGCSEQTELALPPHPQQGQKAEGSACSSPHRSKPSGARVGVLPSPLHSSPPPPGSSLGFSLMAEDLPCPCHALGARCSRPCVCLSKTLHV